MARSPKSINNAPTTVSTPSTSAPSVTTRTRGRKSSISKALGSTSQPSTPLPLSPAAAESPLNSRSQKPLVEGKAHALRSVLGEKERTPCPFPTQYGGKDKCNVTDEDEADEALMATCAACAYMDNRALSAEEIAALAIYEGWLRAPSAAVAPASIINTSIRAHQKRCGSTVPPRPPLLAKYQLAGSVNESVFESALHPEAFAGGVRPKGTVWFLAQIGKARWKNPLAGIEIPKAPPRKPGPTKKLVPKEIRPKGSPLVSAEEKKKAKARNSLPAAAAPRIRLVVGNSGPSADDAISEAGSSTKDGRDSRMGSATPLPTHPSDHQSTAAPMMIRKSSRKLKHPHDSSDDSDTSESDDDINSSRRRMSTVVKIRKERPPPLPLHGNSTPRSSLPTLVSRSLGSPFNDISHPALSCSPTLSNSSFPIAATSSPFPSHSLDNTTWAVRHEYDRFNAFETSSSSSDDDIRDVGTDWGMSSSVLVHDGEEIEEIKAIWSMEDEEAKVKEATDALRVLFPMDSPDEETETQPQIQLNQLDNRPAVSDTSSLAESTSTSTATARGPLKSADLAASMALAAWPIMSSPVPSPHVKFLAHLPLETSPTQHLSRLNHSFDADEMEVDDDPWLDETGELPVKADDSLSDLELGSVIGEALTPEHDRQLDTAAWAREAAVSASFQVKQEIDDYPSPLTTDPDEVSVAGDPRSRAGSSESHTPSSRFSELPPFDIDTERILQADVDEVLMGPESISVEDLDGWLPSMMGRVEKTPQRGRPTKGRSLREKQETTRCGGSWGGIGVGTSLHSPFVKSMIKNFPVTPSRQRSARMVARRRSSTRSVHTAQATQPVRTGAESLPTPPTDTEQVHGDECEYNGDMEVDAIGPADLEAARAEAEEREEKYRKACQEKAEQHKALLEAYRQKVREGQTTGPAATTMTPAPDSWDRSSPFPEQPWGSGSTEPIPIATPGAVFSPNTLHSMSNLSLNTPSSGVFQNAMDPKALLSPPLGPAQQGMTGMLDEAMSQPEVDLILAAPVAESVKVEPATGKPEIPSVQPSSQSAGPVQQKTLPPSAQTTPAPALQPPPTPPVSTTSPVPIAPAPIKPKQDPKATVASIPKKLAPVAPGPAAAPPSSQAQHQTQQQQQQPAAQVPRNATQGQQQIKPQTAVPAAVQNKTVPAKAPGVVVSKAPIPAPTAAARPASAVAKPGVQPLSTAPKRTQTPPNIDRAKQANSPATASTTSTPSSGVSTAPPAQKPSLRTITKPLCAGIDACVVENIPVYSHIKEVKNVKHMLLRRLDTDFVNATSLLNALGVPPAKHAEFHSAPSTWLSTHQTVPLHGSNGVAHAPGVPGVWVRLAEAREYAARLKLPQSNLLSSILREDLFQLFAALANIKPDHTASDNFGLPFVAGRVNPVSSNPSANSSSSSLTSSSANSKSTPNLTSLNGNARPNPVAKGPLVRAAPLQPPDGCPQPKRRRATTCLVGEPSPMAKIAPSVNAFTAASSNIPTSAKKPPQRATRASIAGDTPKPKVVK